MLYVNGAPILPNGRILAALLASGPIAAYANGVPYNAAGAIVLTLGVPEVYNAGIPFRQGAICFVVNENAGPLVGEDGNAGFPVGPLGRLIFSRTRPIVGYINGWPVASNRALAAST